MRALNITLVVFLFIALSNSSAAGEEELPLTDVPVVVDGDDAEESSSGEIDRDSSIRPVDNPDPLWHADADTNGDNAWKGQQEAYPNRLSIVDDPANLYGKVYQAKLVDGDLYHGKARAEYYGSVYPDGSDLRYYEGDTYYFGWRSRISDGLAAPIDWANSGNITQFKGDSTCGGPAIGFTFKHGKLTLRSELYGILWNGPYVADFAGEWHDIVVKIHFSKDSNVGHVELWIDGAQQTFEDGTTRYKVATMCPKDEYVYLKLGIYRNTKLTGTAYHWIESPRIGTSYDSVKPRLEDGTNRTGTFRHLKLKQ